MLFSKINTIRDRYPLPIIFIIGNLFFERFFGCGMTTILTLYLVDILRFSETNATLFYHVYTMLGSFFPVIGGLIADSYLGRYRTILYLSILYASGAVLLTTASTPFFGHLDKRIFSIVGFAAIVIGGGCSSPCVLPFGGDQFISPHHVRRLPTFFSLSYFAVNAAALVSMYVIPILRHNFQCFGEETCFPLAFGVLTFALIMSLVFFWSGKNHYIRKEPEGNIIVDVSKCIFHALKRKFRSKEVRGHWLDHADDKFSKSLIADTKASFQVLFLFLPMPAFWALYDQQGSSWKFQATRMNGDLGWFTIKPDQMQDINPLLIMVFIPLFDLVIYPGLGRRHLLERPLQRFTAGGLLAASAFAMSALLECKLEATYPVLPGEGLAQLRVFNGLDCDVFFDFPTGPRSGVIPALDALQLTDLPLEGVQDYELRFTTGANCSEFRNRRFHGRVVLHEAKSTSVFLHSTKGVPVVSQVDGFDDLDKTDIENPRLRILHSLSPFQSEFLLSQHKFHERFVFEKDTFNTPYKSVVDTGKFTATLSNRTVFADITLGPAGIYTLILHSRNNFTIGRVVEMTPPNRVHILWQLPQYVALTAAEVMFSVTGNEFSYTQAPDSMKSLISASWVMTDAVGNLIVVIIAKSQLFRSHAWEFLLYAVLMVLSMILFMLISCQYQYYDPVRETPPTICATIPHPTTTSTS